MKRELDKFKLLGLVVIAGILMWYFCPWFGRLIEPKATPEPQSPPPVIKPMLNG